MEHNHEIDGKLRDDCDACEYIRGVTSPLRNRAHKEVDNDLGMIMKTALKAKRAEDRAK